MSSAASNPFLRLVGTDDSESDRLDVIRENRTAAYKPLDPADPRWVLAVRAYAQLEGTAMTPERRERVLRTARLLGVRPFDANLIIAIAQDHARTARPLREAEGTLALIRGPEPARRDRSWMTWLAAIAVALVGVVLLARWVTG